MFTKRLFTIVLVVVFALLSSAAVIAQEDTPGKAQPENPMLEWLDSFEEEQWFTFDGKSPILYPFITRNSDTFELEDVANSIQERIESWVTNLRIRYQVKNWMDQVREQTAGLLHQAGHLPKAEAMR